MATRSGTPARTMFRMAVLRKSWKSLVGIFTTSPFLFKTGFPSSSKSGSHNPFRAWAASTALRNHRGQMGCEIKLSIDLLSAMAALTTYCWICGTKLDWSAGTKGGRPKPDSPSLDRKNGETLVSVETTHIICQSCNCRKKRLPLAEYLGRVSEQRAGNC